MTRLGQETAISGPVRAFVRMGYLETVSYPLSSLLGQAGVAVGLISTLFLSRIVREGPALGGSYLTFVLTGIIGQMVVNGAFQGIGVSIDSAVQQGRLETLLIEPIRWPLIPLALGLWPSLLQSIQVVIVIVLGILLGVHLVFGGMVVAGLVAILGIMAGLVMGTLSASVRVLAKRSDPIWLVYGLAAGLVSGAGFPINLLPMPLRVASWLLPTTYVIAGLRKALMPHADAIYGLSSLGDAGALAIFILLGGCFAVWAFNRSLNLGRGLGVLAGY